MIPLLLLALGGTLGVDSAARGPWITGNGGLTAAIDAHGRLAQFHWPGVGLGQHLDTGVDGSGGAGWYVGGAGNPIPLDGARWEIQTEYAAPDSLLLRTRFKERDGERTLEQLVYPAPDRDVLIVRLKLFNVPPDTRLFWVQHFTPYGGRVTGFSNAAPVVRRLNAFGNTYDAGAGILAHFVPEDAGREARKRLQAWTGKLAQAAPSVSMVGAGFGKGIHIGTASTGDVVRGAVLANVTSWSTWDGSGPLPGGILASGPAVGVLELLPQAESGWLESTVLIAAGDTHDALRSLIAEAIQMGPEALEDSAAGLGAARLSTGGGADAGLVGRSLLNLFLRTEGATGAVLCAPTMAHAEVFHSVWVSAALDQRGRPEAAAQALAPHVDSIRRESGARGPAGSLPEAVYSDGVAASMTRRADPDSAAWLLAACWRHALFLPDDSVSAFFDAWWPALDRSMDHLASEPQVGAALSGAAPATTAPLSMLRTHYLGLESGRRLAELLGKPVPGLWSDRLAELYSRIRFRSLNQGAVEAQGDPWIDWWIAAMPTSGAGESAGWAVLRTDSAPGLSESGLLAVGDELNTPGGLRDALRCLLPDAG